MLTLAHVTIGTLVIVTNALAAVWLGLLARWQRPVEGASVWALRVARGALAIQLVLGLALVAGGAVGNSRHYLFALAALGASWVAAPRARRPGRLQPYAVPIGCAATALCALAAYLLARG